MAEKNHYQQLVWIITLGSLVILVLGLAFDFYFRFQSVNIPEILPKNLKTINPSLQGEVLGEIKNATQKSSFVPPEKLPF